ncbi:DUF4222 domain-containing protein [Salmonella enterica subsp. enterica serovar Give]|uniref:DUF4222 domain-containing protein n=2 Tax=Salmonella enterica I TaxID=59201 RepID=A0A8E7NAK8_SALET|nr:DUF4222 domain-containing protein [Salmonella enterica]EAA4605643.1 DUF4222 domain-containing protein [Salmonella enterica subsp. enterica serovar Kisangani]EAA7255813.1 DUF4222 domain-containing protein [Salmonella enterica subsp. enterica serovar Newport]EAB6122491.1 DUF4222 domain-containing protein [Salmonella enterica subsp. enterica serovar Braenderup]EAB9752102.1 DUF4222 domain-containing protein [Salmonella enterica subsp. salamae]EBZ2217798.1 DUF4222 domain-containing protein [Salm
MFETKIKPIPGHKYIDDRGVLITVISVEESRVVFMREGYPHPCMRPIYNFIAKFKRSPDTESG